MNTNKIDLKFEIDINIEILKQVQNDDKLSSILFKLIFA